MLCQQEGPGPGPLVQNMVNIGPGTGPLVVKELSFNTVDQSELFKLSSEN